MKTLHERIIDRVHYLQSIPLTSYELGEVLIETMGGGYAECRITLKRLWKVIKDDTKEVRQQNEARRMIINIEKYLNN